MRTGVLRNFAGSASRAAALLVAGLCLLPVAACSSESDASAQVRPEVADAITAILSLDADPAFGAYLAGDCVTCHRPSGASDGIPAIAGDPAEQTVRALVEYRLKVRDNEVMTVRAARLSDEDIAALAAYFAAQ